MLRPHGNHTPGFILLYAAVRRDGSASLKALLDSPVILLLLK
jgi:hypothetical protein